MLDVTGPSDGGWTRIIPGAGIRGAVSGDGLVDFNRRSSVSYLQQRLIQGALVRMMTEIDTPTGSVLYKMNGYIESIEMVGAVRDLMTFSYNIPIDGQITITDQAGKEEEVGIQNLLALYPGGPALDINNNEDNLIV